MKTHTRKNRKYMASVAFFTMLLGSLVLVGCGNGEDDLPPMDQPVDDVEPTMDSSEPPMDQSTDEGPAEEGVAEETVKEDPMMQQDEGVEGNT